MHAVFLGGDGVVTLESKSRPMAIPDQQALVAWDARDGCHLAATGRDQPKYVPGVVDLCSSRSLSGGQPPSP